MVERDRNSLREISGGQLFLFLLDDLSWLALAPSVLVLMRSTVLVLGTKRLFYPVADKLKIQIKMLKCYDTAHRLLHEIRFAAFNFFLSSPRLGHVPRPRYPFHFLGLSAYNPQLFPPISSLALNSHKLDDGKLVIPVPCGILYRQLPAIE